MVLVRDRSAEQGHDAVAGELVDGALIAVDAPGEDVEAAIHDGVDGLRIETLSERTEAYDIGEENRDELPLTFKGAA